MKARKHEEREHTSIYSGRADERSPKKGRNRDHPGPHRDGVAEEEDEEVTIQDDQTFVDVSTAGSPAGGFAQFSSHEPQRTDNARVGCPPSFRQDR